MNTMNSIIKGQFSNSSFKNFAEGLDNFVEDFIQDNGLWAGEWQEATHEKLETTNFLSYGVVKNTPRLVTFRGNEAIGTIYLEERCRMEW